MSKTVKGVKQNMKIEYKTTELIEKTSVREIEDIENVYFYVKCDSNNSQINLYFGQFKHNKEIKSISFYKCLNQFYLTTETWSHGELTVKNFLEKHSARGVKEITKEEFFEALNKVKQEI